MFLHADDCVGQNKNNVFTFHMMDITVGFPSQAYQRLKNFLESQTWLQLTYKNQTVNY